MDKKYYVYTLEHPETKEIRYIGYSKNPKVRYANHLCIDKLKSKKNSWIKSLKDKGLKPYINIIDEALTIEDIHLMEIKYIAKYKQLGYRLTNMTLGGEGNERPCSEETKLKISKSLKEKYLKENHKIKGIKWSEKRRLEKSKATMGKKPTYGMLNKSHPNKKQVESYKNNVFHKLFNSVLEASKELGLNKGNISNVCSGKNKTAGGYTFKYKNNE